MGHPADCDSDRGMVIHGVDVASYLTILPFITHQEACGQAPHVFKISITARHSRKMLIPPF